MNKTRGKPSRLAKFYDLVRREGFCFTNLEATNWLHKFRYSVYEQDSNLHLLARCFQSVWFVLFQEGMHL